MSEESPRDAPGLDSTADNHPEPTGSTLGAWILGTAFLAVALRWLGPLGTLEAVFLATLLVLMPRLAGAQVAEDDPVLQLDRRAIYRQSGIMLGGLAALSLWLGGRRGGWQYLGLAEIVPSRDAIWTAGLTAAALALMVSFYALRRVTGSRESTLVRYLLPRTGPEKRAFAGLSVMAGVGEELAYRGFALSALIETTGSPAAAAVLSSVAFGWVHAYQAGLGMLRAGALGLLFATPVLFIGSLWPAIFAHTLVDWVGGLVLGHRMLGSDEDLGPPGLEAEPDATVARGRPHGS